MANQRNQQARSARALATTEESPISPIQELKSAFTSILLSQKVAPNNAPLDPLLPQSTGLFTLFKYPRELRDRIYFFAVYRSKGLAWRRRHELGRGSRWFIDYVRHWPTADQDVLSLFLTSRQVYAEALYVFCSCNAIFIERREYSLLEGTLRIFPSRAARMLQKIELKYVDSQPNYHEPCNGPRPGHTLEKMIRDAWLAKEHFPRLRQCTAIWHTDSRYFLDAENMGFDNRTEEFKVEMWLRWMRVHCKRCNLTPPRWLYVRSEVWGAHRFNPMGNHQKSFDQALELFKEEVRAWDLKRTDSYLEDSGKKWLEEEWGDGKRRRGKGKRR